MAAITNDAQARYVAMGYTPEEAVTLTSNAAPTPMLTTVGYSPNPASTKYAAQYTLNTKTPLEDGVVYEVSSDTGYGVYHATAPGVGTYDSSGNLTKVTVEGDMAYISSSTYTGHALFKIECNYETVTYDVYYTDSDRVNEPEVSYVHGSVYTVPKVEPKQWRTKTTVGTVTTYGDWKLLSQATPTGTEGTNYEYMTETPVIRKVSRVTNWKIYANIVYPLVVREFAEITDPIHGDVVGKLRTPEILENLVACVHRDNETVGGAVATRRIARNAGNIPQYTGLVGITKKSNWTSDTHYISEIQATVGQRVEFYVGNGYAVSSSGGYKPVATGSYASTMNGAAIPLTAYEALSALKDNKYSHKVTLTNVTGPIVISGQTQAD